MELDAEQSAIDFFESRDGRRFGVCGHTESGWCFLYRVAVAGPDSERRTNAGEQATRAVAVEVRIAVLATPGWANFGAENLTHELHAVADSEDGDVELQKTRAAAWCVGLIDTLRATGKDEASQHKLRALQAPTDLVQRCGERQNLTID